jgi:transitional endoplasmic reticulum ATPase
MNMTNGNTTSLDRLDAAALSNAAIDPIALLEAMNALTDAKDVITGNEVDFHDGKKIVLPRGMTYSKARRILDRLQKEAETPTDFMREFKFRADDGAFAALQVIKARYGMLLGNVIDMGFWGKINAQYRTIAVGPNQTMQVPWGSITIPSCEGLELYLAETRHKDYGRIFRIHGSGPRKYKDEVEALFDAIEEYLGQNSIYRGRALVGSNDLDFIDLSTFDPRQVVFSDEVTDVLNGTLWSPLRYTDAMRRENISLKRAVLIHGPYGTGKTSTGQITAQIANEHGWTFISAKPGRDNIEDVLRTARLYQPAVVFVEDIDVETATGEADAVSKMLDAFDGITAKGGELMVLMTSNHLDRIHKGMLRPGRLDAVVEVAALDRNGCERLIKAVVDPTKLDPTTDYDAVFESMKGFLPAFIREAITRSVTFSINRLEGAVDYTIGTDDLVGAAHSLRPQFDALEAASEGVKAPTLDKVFTDAARKAVLGLRVQDNAHGEVNYIVDPEGDED